MQLLAAYSVGLGIAENSSYNMRMKDAVVRPQIDSELKKQAAAVLASYDVEVSDASRLFLNQVVKAGGLRFAAHRRESCPPGICDQ